MNQSDTSKDSLLVQHSSNQTNITSLYSVEASSRGSSKDNIGDDISLTVEVDSEISTIDSKAESELTHLESTQEGEPEKDKPKVKTPGESYPKKYGNCTNPCYCIKDLEAAIHIIIVSELIMSGITIGFGLWCCSDPESVFTTLISNEENSAASKKLEIMIIQRLGLLYTAFGVVSIFLSYLLYKGMKLRRRKLCIGWSSVTIVSAILLFVGLWLVLFNPGQKIGQNFGTPLIQFDTRWLIFFLVTTVSTVLNLYFVYVVSIYGTILQMVDRTYALIHTGLVDEDELDEEEDQIEVQNHEENLENRNEEVVENPVPEHMSMDESQITDDPDVESTFTKYSSDLGVLHKKAKPGTRHS